MACFGELQNHELDREPVLHNLFQALVLRDAVLHVHHVIADGEVAKIGDKRRRLRSLGLGPRRDIGFVGEIVGAEDNQIRLGKADARGKRRAHNDRHAQIAGQVAGLVEHGFAAGMRGAAAQPIGNLVLAQHRGHALHIALVRRGQHDARAPAASGFAVARSARESSHESAAWAA